MKERIFTTVTGLLMACLMMAQAPAAFKYQAVIRDHSGNLLADQNVELRIDILKGAVDGTAVYSETHSTMTNQFGLVTLEIGSGTTTDDLSAVLWDADSYFLKIWVDGSEIGTSQLLSVPYALHARTVDMLLEKGDTPCSAANRGAIRYDSNEDLVLFCNGSEWMTLSGGLYMELATVLTNGITEITISSAVTGGTIGDNGGVEIFEKGVCWNTEEDPDINHNHTMDGSGSGDFISHLNGLISNEKYHVRAYAKNALGTGYGDDVEFITLAHATETKKAEYVSNTSFTTGGTVVDGGGEPISDKGIVYALDPNPTLADLNVSAGPGAAEFEVTVDLIDDETYYYRSYVRNTGGDSFGPEKTYRNHYVTENNISIMPTTVQFSQVYGDSFMGPVAVSTEDGKGNTDQLLNKLGSKATAAYMCDTLTAKGFTDWFLPAIEELDHLFINKDVIGITDYTAYYWSSTVNSTRYCWAQEFQDGQQQLIDFAEAHRIICIRRKE